MSIKIKTHNYSVVRNTTGGRATPRYIVLHYTATPRATAQNELMFFATNPAAIESSADFFVDDNEIIQYNNMLDTRYSWAVGVDYSSGTAPYWGKCTNSNSISIEMSCDYEAGSWYISEKTYQNAVAITKYLMEKYGIPASNAIRHYDVCGKTCPGAIGWIPQFGDGTWKRFKNEISGSTSSAKPAATPTDSTKTVSTPIYRVRKAAGDAVTQKGAFAVLRNAKSLADTFSKQGYKVFDMSGKLVYDPITGKSTASKTVEQVAREVIAGKWGNGDDRRKRLESAGYNYGAVQSAVNKLMGV